jgi:type I restriction enzyme S subunit
MSEGKGLPKGWAEAPLAECAELITKGSTPTTYGHAYQSEGIPFVRVEHLRGGVIARDSITEFIDDKADEDLKRSRLTVGDVLFSLAGTIGRTAIVREGDTPANTNQAVGIIRGIGRILDGLFLRYVLGSSALQQVAKGRKRGGTMNNISLEDLKSFIVPIAPLPEQHRLVEKIEELFSDLDAGVASLQRAKANLKRYRASVLKSAVEGRLTEDWRKEHPQAEDGQMLLDRILRERREKWEKDQLAQFKKKGKEPPKNWQSKYEEPSAPDTNELPELPEGWAWASLEQITSPERVICYGILMPKENVTDGVLYVKVRDMKGDRIDLEGLQRTTHEIASQYARASLVPGDLLLSIRGTYGRVALVPPELDGGNITQDTARVAVTTRADHLFVAAWLRADYAQRYFKRVARGVAVKGVNIGDLRPLPVPLPPLAEQEQIVALVEERLSQIDSAEKTIDAELIRSKRLRQSILKRAFEGRLVPQDPKDEPASVLLERIKASREAEQPKKKAKKVKAK